MHDLFLLRMETLLNEFCKQFGKCVLLLLLGTAYPKYNSPRQLFTPLCSLSTHCVYISIITTITRCYDDLFMCISPSLVYEILQSFQDFSHQCPVHVKLAINCIYVKVGLKHFLQTRLSRPESSSKSWSSDSVGQRLGNLYFQNLPKSKRV